MHPLQHQLVFNILKGFYERNYPDLDTLVQVSDWLAIRGELNFEKCTLLNFRLCVDFLYLYKQFAIQIGAYQSVEKGMEWEGTSYHMSVKVESRSKNSMRMKCISKVIMYDALFSYASLKFGYILTQSKG